MDQDHPRDVKQVQWMCEHLLRVLRPTDNPDDDVNRHIEFARAMLRRPDRLSAWERKTLADLYYGWCVLKRRYSVNTPQGRPKQNLHWTERLKRKEDDDGT